MGTLGLSESQIDALMQLRSPTQIVRTVQQYAEIEEHAEVSAQWKKVEAVLMDLSKEPGSTDLQTVLAEKMRKVIGAVSVSINNDSVFKRGIKNGNYKGVGNEPRDGGLEVDLVSGPDSFFDF